MIMEVQTNNNWKNDNRYFNTSVLLYNVFYYDLFTERADQ